MADPGWGGGGGGGGGGEAVSKIFFLALRASVWFKNSGDQGPQVPTLDPPLSLSREC